MIVRDFIYVDAERVYSLYSQMFEGVAQQIVRSSTSSLSTSETMKGSPLSGKETETRGDEALLNTETRVLYDHIYNQLEDRLGKNVTHFPTRGTEDEISVGAFVKVTGVGEVEDYSRLDKFLTHFNKLGEAIAFALSQSSGISEAVKTLEDAAQTKRDRNQKARATAAAKSAGDKAIKTIARESGLHQDHRLIEGLKLFTEIFNPAGLEVVVTPDGSDGDVVIKAVLNRRWLRVGADFLRTLHAGNPAAGWTIVGQVTHRPGAAALPTRPDAGSSMRAAFGNMFRASREVERLFFESNDREELIVSPLAVYRETELHDNGA